MNTSKRNRVIAAAVGVALVAGVGVGWAQIPGTDGVIHACYSRYGGLLRVVNTGQPCALREISLAWNQAGVQGPKGDPGATGPAGPPGPQGDPGPALGASGGVLRILSFDQPCGGDVVIKKAVHLSRPSIISVDGMIQSADGALVEVTVATDVDGGAPEPGPTRATITGIAVSLDGRDRTLVNGLLRDSSRGVLVAAGDYLLGVHTTCSADTATSTVVFGEIDFLVTPAA